MRATMLLSATSNGVGMNVRLVGYGLSVSRYQGIYKNKSCICHKGRLVLPKPLQSCAVMWYHHYLQHPGHTRLEETMKSAIYWKVMRSTIQSKTKSCKTCQVNKKRTQKYGHLPSKIVISTPWEALCVNLVGPYTLKGKDGSSIGDFSWLSP